METHEPNLELLEDIPGSKVPESQTRQRMVRLQPQSVYKQTSDTESSMKTKVLLTVKCRRMKDPKQQRYKFDQTLISASWMLQDNKKPIIHEDGTVTTASVWGRMFAARKSEAEIDRIVQNLIKRAADFSAINDYSTELDFKTVAGPADEFEQSPVLTSDD